MVPLPFFDEAEDFATNRCPLKKSANNHLEIGAVIARVGPPHLPHFIQSFVGMLHFGIITKEVLGPMNSKSTEIADLLYFEDKRWLRNFYLKRQYFDRFKIQHYEKRGTSAQVKETSLGSFLFGDDCFLSGNWYNAKFPKAFKIMISTPNVETLHRQLKKLSETLGETKYSLWSRNCESYCMEIAYDKEAENNITSVQIWAVLIIVLVIIVSIVILVLFITNKKKKKLLLEQ